MNVFEDLIEELRDENLLENPIIGMSRAGAGLPTNRGSLTTASDSVVDINNPASRSGDSGRSTTDLSIEPEENERDFYRKRAMDEISSLQMVEDVLSGIEREHMKVSTSAYDDLEAKKALHKFLQVQGDSATTEYAEAEMHLMRETEAWS